MPRSGAEETKHEHYLDALRGIAVLGVLVVHSGSWSQVSGTLLGFTTAGQRGVQLFYMLSAFTLFMSMERRTTREASPLLNYGIRRFFRIAPMYYLAALLLIWLHNNPSCERYIAQLEHVLQTGVTEVAPPEVHHHRFHFNAGLSYKDLALGAVFLNGWKLNTINNVVQGGWSIAVESNFYMVFPLVFLFVRTIPRALFWVVGAGLALSALSYWLAFRYPPLDFYLTILWFPIEFPVFLMGILTFLLLREIRPSRLVKEEGKAFSLALLLFSLFFFYFTFPVENARLFSSCLALVPFIIALAIHPWSLLVNPVTRFLGKISYSVYLLHFYGYRFMAYYMLQMEHAGHHIVGKASGFLFLFLGLLAFGVVAATIAHYLVERPGMAFGRELIRFLERRRGAA